VIFVVRSREREKKEHGLKSKQFRRGYSKIVQRHTGMHYYAFGYRKLSQTSIGQVKQPLQARLSL
jgi:hypothetical protein